MLSQVLTRDQANEVRRIMNMVTEGGTGTAAMAHGESRGHSHRRQDGNGAKGSTANRSKNRQVKRGWFMNADSKGKIIRQYEETVMADKKRRMPGT